MPNFEKEKNLKASAYTLLVVGSILALFFIVSWAPPVAPPPPDEEGMEVNLGDSETGDGDIQPLIPGEPSAVTEEAISTPPPTSPVQTAEKEIETNDEDKEAPPIIANKPKDKPKEKPVVKPTPEPAKPVPHPKEESKPAETPPAPKPKYVYKGTASGQGGNNATTYQASNGQGIAGGKGDQGKINGNPNADSYTGNGGSGSGGGVSVSRGLQGRKINRYPSFEDEFSENAKVAVDIKVDTKGNIISVAIQPRGTTTSNASMKAIALQKARQLKFNDSEEGPEEDLGTIVFNFRIRN